MVPTLEEIDPPDFGKRGRTGEETGKPWTVLMNGALPLSISAR